MVAVQSGPNEKTAYCAGRHTALYCTSKIPIMSNFLARVCIRESFLKVFASIESLSYRDHVESLKQEL